MRNTIQNTFKIEDGASVVSQGKSDRNGKKTVISTRPPSPGDQDAVADKDIRLVYYPAWNYRWITPPEYNIRSIINNPQNPAWVFTSRRGVEGWWRVWRKQMIGGEYPGHRAEAEQKAELAESEEDLETLLPRIYVVGNKTGQEVRRLFHAGEIRKPELQNGHSLAGLLANDNIRSAVHFCSVNRRHELRVLCQEKKISLTEVEVYQGYPVTDPEPVRESADAILFFSPNGVSGFRRLYGLPEGDWKPVAVGSTTARAVREETGREPVIAPEATFSEMIKLV